MLLLLALLGVAVAAPIQETRNITERAFDVAGITERDVELQSRFLDFGNKLTNGPYTTLNAGEISSWATWAHFASAIYCGLERINNWTCGEDCDAVKATTLASGGDDGLTPLWYVADNGQNVVVGVAGTNTDNLLSYAVDIDFIPTALEDSYFPGVKAKVHRGFYKAFKRMAQPILAAAQNATASGKEVVVTGHSLGAGVGMILSVYLQLHLSVPVNARLFAAPRVGNADWANAVDKIVGVRQQHIVNFNDIVPHLPFLHWGFRHPAGEVYIAQVGGSEYRFCEGQENEHCAGQWNDLKGEMGSYFDYLTTPTHSGPFAGVMVTDDKCAS